MEIEKEPKIKIKIKRETETLTIARINRERDTEIKRETEMSLRQQTHKYETPGVVFYLLPVQFISQNELIISTI